MTDTRKEFMTPVGRLVQGSLYEGRTTGMNGQKLTFKDPNKANEERVDFYFAVAFQKSPQDQGHWANTEWGKILWEAGHAAFPGGQSNSPNFYWKVLDGDSTIVNTEGNRPCDYEGFAGHWILKFKGTTAPILIDKEKNPLTQKGFIKLGYYVRILGSVTGNKSTQTPGLFINYKWVCFFAYGQEIMTGTKLDDLNFADAQLPAGASPVPLTPQVVDMRIALNGAAPLNLPNTVSQPVIPVITSPAIPVNPAVTPYTQILTPQPPALPVLPIAPPMPVMPTPVNRMTAKAGNYTYEQFKGQNWTDEMLIAEGYMTP